VDLLVVRDHLAELAELEEDDFAARRVAWQRVLAHLECLEEIQVEPLDVVDRVPLARGEVAAGLQHLQRRGPFSTGRDQRGLVPELLQLLGLHFPDHESKDANDRLDLRAVEEPVQALDDERDTASPQFGADGLGVLRDRPEQHRAVRPRQTARL
jgi:hypothetical protein